MHTHHIIGGGLLVGIVIFLSMVLFNRQPLTPVTDASPSTNTPFSTDRVEFKEIASHSVERVETAYQSFLGSSPANTQQIDQYELHYNLIRQDHEPLEISAQVFIPTQLDPATQLPVIVYGPGTTGLADRCAPSEENPFNPTLGNYTNQMLAHANQGAIVIMPDYLGFSPQHQLQHYFIAEEEAYSMLSAAQAFFALAHPRLVDLPIAQNQIFLGGYSQGGHSAFASADFVSELTPELLVMGVIGHGPTNDLSDLLLANPNLAPYVTTAYQQYYPDFPSDQIIQANFLSSLDEATRICADEGFGYNTLSARGVYTPAFLDALQTNTLEQKFPVINRILMENDAGHLFTRIPVFIAQGTSDPIVSQDQQNAFAKSLCDRNIPLTYYLYEDVHHFFTRQESFEDTHEWIDQVLSGKVTSACVIEVRE